MLTTSPFTTISLSRETVQKLKNLGRKGETYDQIIRKLIGETERA